MHKQLGHCVRIVNGTRRAAKITKMEHGAIDIDKTTTTAAIKQLHGEWRSQNLYVFVNNRFLYKILF